MSKTFIFICSPKCVSLIIISGKKYRRFDIEVVHFKVMDYKFTSKVSPDYQGISKTMRTMQQAQNKHSPVTLPWYKGSLHLHVYRCYLSLCGRPKVGLQVEILNWTQWVCHHIEAQVTLAF